MRNYVKGILLIIVVAIVVTGINVLKVNERNTKQQEAEDGYG